MITLENYLALSNKMHFLSLRPSHPTLTCTPKSVDILVYKTVTTLFIIAKTWK